jgi:uncharacterized protein
MPSTTAPPRRPFQKLQYEFAAHLRHPQQNAAPAGIEERRLQIYRDLFYNNVEDFLAKAFPVLRQLSSDAVWHARVRDFYARHRCHEPQFHQIAAEFLRYLEFERGSHPDDPPFLRELCHYEWVELALSVADIELTPDPRRVEPEGDLLAGRPVLSPLAWLLVYQWPVQRIGPGFGETQPPPAPTYLVVNRNRRDDVKFLEINVVTARLLELLRNDRRSSGRRLLQNIARELQHPQPEAVVQGGAALLAQLRERDIILGTWRRPPRGP